MVKILIYDPHKHEHLENLQFLSSHARLFRTMPATLRIFPHAGSIRLAPPCLPSQNKRPTSPEERGGAPIPRVGKGGNSCSGTASYTELGTTRSHAREKTTRRNVNLSESPPLALCRHP
jgi:hypothetical protein